MSEPDPVRSTSAGVRHVHATGPTGRARVSLLFHPPLQEVVERRVRFVLDHQRAPERGGSRAAAFLPYDTTSGLTVLEGGWGDWSESRERVGTALMLQEARRRGWGDADELDAAVSAYAVFVREHVVGADGVVRGDNAASAGPRLYNFPWFARFLLDLGDVDLAAMIMERYYALGGNHFLAFDLGTVVPDLVAALRERGDDARAAQLEADLVRHARTMIDHDDDLPAHEVSYEQSMVAPLLGLLLAVRRLDEAAVPDAALLRRLAWLRAFAGDQPDVRLRHVAVRHWDGYWFGGLRLWGDAFPHHWSCLSAAAYLAWPSDVGPPGLAAELQEAAYAILRANLASFFTDGSATCAFVYPSCVDGRPAHVADPLANDQDWALVHAMRHGLGPEPDGQNQAR